ncbi:MAG: hypothetical protein AAF616_13345 [Bacteroidota bacterium]
MVLLDLLLLFIHPLSNDAYISSKVTFDEDHSDCTITYSIPVDATEPSLLYKNSSASSWQVIDLETLSGQETIEDLEKNTLFSFKLIWQEGSTEFQSETRYFLSHAILPQVEPFFNSFRSIKAKEFPDQITHELHNTNLNFSYSDKYQKSGFLLGEVRDDQNILVARFSTDKVLKGMYHLDIAELNLIPNTTYHFKVGDGNNPDKFFKIMILQIVSDFTSNISVDPIAIDCGNNLGSIVSFYSDITGGTGPFEVSWSIENLDKSSLIFGPQSQTLRMADEVSMINVNFSLPYVVTLSCFDACGRFSEYAVVLSCNEVDGDDAVLIQPSGSSTNNGNGAFEN